MIRTALMNVMTAAVLKAGRGLKRDLGEIENLQVSSKGPGDFVSLADKRSEKTLYEELAKARPGYGFVMEEAGRVEGTDKSHTWHIDPLDATTNFLHAIPIFAISVALAFILAPGKGISTSAWTSSTGLNDLFQSIFHAWLTTVFYGVFGAGLGILLRSPAASIGVSLAYFIAIEAIIVGAIWSGGSNWLPDHLLSELARGGNADATYYHALLMLAIYAVAVAAGTVALFRRRDA